MSTTNDLTAKYSIVFNQFGQSVKTKKKYLNAVFFFFKLSNTPFKTKYLKYKLR